LDTGAPSKTRLKSGVGRIPDLLWKKEKKVALVGCGSGFDHCDQESEFGNYEMRVSNGENLKELMQCVRVLRERR